MFGTAYSEIFTDSSLSDEGGTERRVEIGSNLTGGEKSIFHSVLLNVEIET